MTDARSIRFRHLPVKPRLAPCRTIRSAPTIARKPAAGSALPLSRQRSSLAALLPRRPRHPHGQMEPGGDGTGTSRGCFVAEAMASRKPPSQRKRSSAWQPPNDQCSHLGRPRQAAGLRLNEPRVLGRCFHAIAQARPDAFVALVCLTHRPAMTRRGVIPGFRARQGVVYPSGGCASFA